MYYLTEYGSPVGRLTMASDGEHLVGLWLEGQKYFLASLPEMSFPKDDLPFFARVGAWLDSYFAGERPNPGSLPLAPFGTPFRRRVWERLLSIPYGEMVTYGHLARELGVASPRTVGGAVGHNPISIVIPCHRVVGAKGALTGYAGGLAAKKRLLALEGAELPQKGDSLLP